jgi:pimeloyl-ACP methyl ester carboxylesterase
MYYELHGDGPPLLLLHGAYMTIELIGPIVPGLAESHQVIAVELQGHGRTADVDRPITYEQLADDAAALLGHLGNDSADVVGYSMGGGVALQLAIRHPDVVRKLVVASASYTSYGMHKALLEMLPSTTPEVFAGSPIEEAYLRLAPNPTTSPRWCTSSRGSTQHRSTGRLTRSARSSHQPRSSSAIPTPSASSTPLNCSDWSAAA